jgi:hypothetical protein
MRRAPALPLVVLVLVPAAARAQGDPVGPEFRVNTFTPGNEFGASVSPDALGNFVVVWQSASQDGSLTGIFGQRYAASGTPLGPEFRVNTYTTSNQFTSAVASDASGNFVAVWTSQLQDGSNFSIHGQRYAGAGAPAGPEFRVNTYTTGSQFIPAVAAAPSGDFVVAWMSPDGSDYGIFAQRYSSAGAPVGPEFRVSTFTIAYQATPTLAADPTGGFVVVWASDGQDGSSYGIFGQRYDAAGAPLGGEFRVNTYTTGTQSGPEVGGDGAGSFVVVWQSSPQDGPGTGIFGQRYAASGAPMGGEFRVNTYTTSDQTRPVVALDSSGNFVVAWQSAGQDGSANGVFAQRYDAAGAPLGAEFRVNTFVAGEQVDPAVAAAAAGHFVVVWSSDGQDGSNYGVFGQRYSPIVPVELLRFGVE